MAKLEEWSIISDDSNPFLAPELRTVRLKGIAYNRDGFDDASIITTSRIVSLDIKNNLAITKNTEYTLGKPSNEYVMWLRDNGKKLEDYTTILTSM